jgi:hypothetical protein
MPPITLTIGVRVCAPLQPLSRGGEHTGFNEKFMKLLRGVIIGFGLLDSVNIGIVDGKAQRTLRVAWPTSFLQ